ncbi:histidine kinase [Clostridium estertheticum]|uniref:histidine kinase n=1 Tax=Clostridium estertheticum TaxID=238834 RepID=A0A5N7IKP3_9CLOT|nr:sensor histidine kinase [Clostridium estertheticum]MPQ30874.1 histidine kinase [Clostridium estertheticum]MPQ61550.1 histidine kinase [Clostridium estertheticum]
MNNENIYNLCKIHTNLDEDDICKIQQMSLCVKNLAVIANADIFIDCPTRDADEAIVVAQAKSSCRPSLYKNSVVGELALRNNEPAVLRTLDIGIASKDLKAVTQEHINVRQTVSPIDNKGKIIGVLIVEKDITEKINKNKHMQMMEQGYEQLANTLVSLTENENNIAYHLDEAVIIFDEEGVVRFNNPIADFLYKKLGYKDKLLGMDYDNLALDDTNFMEVMSAPKSNECEVHLGKLYYNVKRIILTGKNSKLVTMIRDITMMKDKEKELILKSVAIKEIHHRVKNNLQTIASLLRLQARRSDNQQTKDALNESMNRILSMAATHELLSKEGLDEVSIQEVITNIRNNAVRYFNVTDKNIEVNVIGDNFKVSSDKATSIALIVNELLQNSMQYAFINKPCGNIDLIIETSKIYSTIVVVDNGTGFDINNVRKNSLGLSIVNSLVQDKLDGNINIASNSEGTKVVFDFKN